VALTLISVWVPWQAKKAAENCRKVERWLAPRVEVKAMLNDWEIAKINAENILTFNRYSMGGWRRVFFY